MSRNRPGPAGPTIDHDHSGPGQGGDQLDVGEIIADDIAIDDDDTLDFGTDDDYGIRYDPGDSRLEIFSSAQGDILRVADGDVAVELLGDLTVQGQTTEVDDIVTTDVDVQDAGGTSQFFIDGDATTPFMSLEGNHIDNIGGTSAANAGALRLANAVAVNWRSSEDDGDFGWRLDAAENMIYAAAGVDRAQFEENGDLTMEGTLTEGAAL